MAWEWEWETPLLYEIAVEVMLKVSSHLILKAVEAA
jgi:hypothetical protein